MNDEWEVKLVYDEMRARYSLYLISFKYPLKRVLMRTIDGGWEERTLKEGESSSDIEPIMYLSEATARNLATELAEKGIKPKQASFVEGKLEAQNNHLKDLRKLLKLND